MSLCSRERRVDPHSAWIPRPCGDSTFVIASDPASSSLSLNCYHLLHKSCVIPLSRVAGGRQPCRPGIADRWLGLGGLMEFGAQGYARPTQSVVARSGSEARSSCPPWKVTSPLAVTKILCPISA